MNWRCGECAVVSLGGGDVLCLGTFLALRDFHRHSLTFVQGFTAFAVDRTVMYEDVLAIFLLNETITFVIAEPLDGSGYSLCHI